ncbi:MAG TPA: 50S ribosomal protein L21 [Gaiellaceae bacterium]|jgi:large subunit ribosomal protein L21|nr:50S ribosomal protein L21 [Gaiellaceae bacterium]
MTLSAIISVGGKQYRVQEGARLLVDRIAQEEGKTFHPQALLVAENGKTELVPKGFSVTARVVGHVRGEKVHIGKYKRRTGYRRKTGFRAALTELEIEKLGSGRAPAAPAKAEKPAAEKPAAEKPAAEKPAAPKQPERPAGMPRGYEELTVAQIAEAAPGWRRPQLEAALTFERDHGARKGAIAALESALAAKEAKS